VPLRVHVSLRNLTNKTRPRLRTSNLCRVNVLHCTIRHGEEVTEMSFARQSDPRTSHLAAASISADHKVNVRTVILKLLELTPMTDPELCQAYTNLVYIGQAPKASDQHIRTQRKMLHDLQLVHVVGMAQTESGRQARVWRKA
jgi:hypothetical protein